MTETSNSVLDSSVWEAVVPQSALSWQRVLVANWLSSNGADWAHWIKKHNSGEEQRVTAVPKTLDAAAVPRIMHKHASKGTMWYQCPSDSAAEAYGWRPF